MSTPNFDDQQQRRAARQSMVPTVTAVAEVMGGRPLSNEAIGVLAERAARDVAVGRAALKWLSENDSGTLTLAKLVKAMADMASQVRNQHSADGGCSASGCPLPGTITTGGGWHCRFHLRAVNGPEADIITQTLRQNSDLIETISELDRSTEKGAWELNCKMELLVYREITKGIDSQKDRIEAYNAVSKKQAAPVLTKAASLLATYERALQ